MSNTETATADAVALLAHDLRALRRRADLTQRGLAARINYSHVTVVKAETGRRVPTWEVTAAIVKECAGAGDLAVWKERWRAVRGGAHEQPLSTVERIAVPLPVPAAPPEHLPVPGSITTVPEYVHALDRLRTASIRAVVARARTVMATDEDHTAPAPRSTIADLFRPGRVWLEWDVVRTYLLGCGVHQSNLDHWRTLLWRVQGWSRGGVGVRREVVNTPPPVVDLNAVDSPASFVQAVKELTGLTGVSMAEVIERAYRHKGAHIYGRSTVASRFHKAVNHGVMPERTLIKAYLRGCYCPSSGYRGWCVADCSADEIAPWMRLYDGIHASRFTDRRIHR